jgi:hypothetical protein
VDVAGPTDGGPEVALGADEVALGADEVVAAALVAGWLVDGWLVDGWLVDVVVGLIACAPPPDPQPASVRAAVTATATGATVMRRSGDLPAVGKGTDLLKRSYGSSSRASLEAFRQPVCPLSGAALDLIETSRRVTPPADVDR